MLTHHFPTPTKPVRVVIIGAGGFVGKAVADRMEQEGVPVVRVTRAEVDLLAADAGARLGAILRDGDSVVAAAAIAPCKTIAMLRDNLILVQALIEGIGSVIPAHVVTISSDAVFCDQDAPLTEESAKAPDSYHGIMHLARELAFRSDVKAPLAILRPTLIYGAHDPHNGYGPNQFRRKANRGEDITLFGEGEERRDHVHVGDVADLVARTLLLRSAGSLNLATGVVTSFRDIAQLATRLSGRTVAVTGSPRKGAMPHNGYRPFDPSATTAAFPDFVYTPLAEGMAQAQAEEFPRG